VYDSARSSAAPSASDVLDAVRLCKDVSAQAVIGLGGAACLDIAKVASFLAVPHQQQALDDLYGVGLCRGARLPLIQVPTMASTGSEATSTALIGADKRAITASQLLPDVILLDAALTTTPSREMTARGGFDSLTHAVEAMTCRARSNPMSDMLARGALSLLGQHLVALSAQAADGGENLAAREACLMASMWAGMAYENAPLGAVHAIAFALEHKFPHVAHGEAVSMLLPHVVRFNELDLPSRDVYAQACQAAFPNSASADLAEELLAWSRTLGLATSLRQFGIDQLHLDSIAEAAVKQTRLMRNNPRDINVHDVVRILERALG
jgi:alcohol dehydrogenase class IV